MGEKEFHKLALLISKMNFGKALVALQNVYAQGYADGHSACCDELLIKDGDLVITMDEDDLRRRLESADTVDDQMAAIFNVEEEEE